MVAEAKALVSTNVSPQVGASVPNLTLEEKEAAEMRDLLDDGQTLAALRHARNLIDSEEKSIRSLVLDTLAWIGRRALPEITEMINDSVPEIAEQALSAWEQAFAEVGGQNQKAAIIIETLPRLNKPHPVSAILQCASEFDEDVALQMLAQIIDSNSTNFVGECAREMYTHISGGEVYESREVTKRFCEQAKSPKTIKEGGIQ